MIKHSNTIYRASITIAIIFAILLCFGEPAFSQSNEDCLSCHEESEHDRTGTYDGALNMSIHSGMDCIDCHASIEELPHEEEVEDVDCGLCHEEAAEIYQYHGRISITECVDIPCCSDCHGKHDILPPSDRNSRVNPVNLPSTCGHCHEDIDLTKKHEILYGHAVEVYESSVHGQAALGGVYVAATCNDCHSSGGTAHRIIGPANQESSINHFNIPKTCGKCHRNVEKDYWEGIHGKLVERGETDAPVCTDCHGEHGIISPSDPRSRVSPTRVAEATCSPCHESARLNEKYDLPTGRLQTYIDSYHGLKSMAGDLTVANCASCHGAHRILPHTDSTSSIYPGNLTHTCGECHPGISSEMANTPIHGTPGITSTPIASIVQNIYIIAIVVIIGAMVLHWLIDLRKKIKQLGEFKQIRRMTLNEVWQHTFLMVTFIVLVITGFALRHAEAFWVDFLFGWEGGFPLRGIIHRVAAVLFILTVVWHSIYLMTPRGKKFIRDMWPVKKDFLDFFRMNSYNLGIGKERPRMGRFTYVEKAEYWALVWGTVVMIFSGFFLWFEDYAVELFPKGFLDIMLIVHYYEALLASLAILIWHMYSTVFNPDVYPMNPSWYTGKMPRQWYEHEHSEDPVLQNPNVNAGIKAPKTENEDQKSEGEQ